MPRSQDVFRRIGAKAKTKLVVKEIGKIPETWKFILRTWKFQFDWSQRAKTIEVGRHVEKALAKIDYGIRWWWSATTFGTVVLTLFLATTLF